MPHIQKVFESYRSDEKVAFLLISLDDDPKRLARYVEEQKFAMPVAHTTLAVARERFNVTDVPTTFYIDREGIVRYEARGLDSHGESADRVSWFIEELKRQ